MPNNAPARGTPLAAALLIAVAALGAAVATISSAHAAPEPPFDRALLERLVRAEEAQAHSIDSLTRAIERCKR